MHKSNFNFKFQQLDLRFGIQYFKLYWIGGMGPAHACSCIVISRRKALTPEKSISIINHT